MSLLLIKFFFIIVFANSIQKESSYVNKSEIWFFEINELIYCPYTKSVNIEMSITAE